MVDIDWMTLFNTVCRALGKSGELRLPIRPRIPTLRPLTNRPIFWQIRGDNGRPLVSTAVDNLSHFLISHEYPMTPARQYAIGCDVVSVHHSSAASSSVNASSLVSSQMGGT